MFDAISYCKGASVVRMLHAVLGAQDFKKGLQVVGARARTGPSTPKKREQTEQHLLFSPPPLPRDHHLLLMLPSLPPSFSPIPGKTPASCT